MIWYFLLAFKVLVTGANGFLGSSVCRYLSCFGFDVYAFSRRHFPVCSSITPLILPTIAALSSRIDLLSRFDAVVHLAGRAHIMKDNSANPLAEFRRVNVFDTELLAEACSVAGIRRFVFISSIKVNGEISDSSVPFTSQAPLVHQIHMPFLSLRLRSLL